MIYWYYTIRIQADIDTALQIVNKGKLFFTVINYYYINTDTRLLYRLFIIHTTITIIIIIISNYDTIITLIPVKNRTEKKNK